MSEKIPQTMPEQMTPEIMSPENVRDAFLEKDGGIEDTEAFENISKTISSMMENPGTKKINLRFGLEDYAIKMKNFLQKNNGWLRDTFGIEATEVDRMKDSLMVNFESNT